MLKNKFHKKRSNKYLYNFELKDVYKSIEQCGFSPLIKKIYTSRKTLTFN